MLVDRLAQRRDHVRRPGQRFPAALSELFPARVRVTGYSIGYNVAVAVFGGSVPLVSTWLIARTGSALAPSYVLIAAAAVSLVTVLRMPETAHTPLRG